MSYLSRRVREMREEDDNRRNVTYDFRTDQYLLAGRWVPAESRRATSYQDYPLSWRGRAG